MAAINGTLIVVLSGSDKILHNKNATLNVNVNLPDATTKGSAGWAAHINGLRDWSISMDGLYDEEGTGITPSEVLAAIIARSADTAMKFSPDGVGTVGWTGAGTFQGLTLGGAVEEPATSNYNIKGNGPLAPIT